MFGYKISQCNKLGGRHRGMKALATLERVEGREKREKVERERALIQTM